MHATVRTAGWATLGFAIAFFVTFAVNAAINTLIDYPDLPTAGDMAADFGGGVVFVVTWSTAGAALVVCAVALPAVVWPPEAIAGRVATAFGIVAAGGWIMSGVTGFAQRTALLNGNIAAAGADIASERAVIEGLFVGVHTGGILFAVAMLPCLAIVAVGAARRHAMSTVAVVFLWIAAVAPLAGFLMTGLQLGFLVALVAFAVVGASLLRRARRAGRYPNSRASSVAEAPAPAA